jgi:pimeloyl-ACP methyl ester carboxylesterase
LLQEAAMTSDPRVPSADGVPIHYRMQGQGAPTLVFVHGWAYDSGLWDAQAGHFAKTNQVVTLDLGGHGQSGKGRKDWTMEAFGEDVAAVVRKLDLDRVVLIGHSMSGPVILEAARRIPDRVVGLVPVDTLSNVEQKESPEELEKLFAGLQADFKKATGHFMRNYMFTKSTSPEFIETVVQKTSAMEPAIGIAALRHTWSYDARPALQAIKAPIVAVNADLWPANLEAARRHAPQFDVVLVKGLGHYLMREDPARFNPALEEALQRVAAAKGK